MMRALILACLGLTLVVCAWAAPVTFSLNPNQTFLFQTTTGTGSFTADVDSTALFISLTCPGATTDCINAAAGSTLQLTAVGLQCDGGPAATCTEQAASLGGIFDSTDTEASSASLTSGNVNRLGASNTINAGLPDINNPAHLDTWRTGVDTTIPNDFYVPTASGADGNIATLSAGGISVVVPTGANYLVIGDLDSYFVDNSDRSGTLGIMINVIPASSSVPEPATLGLLAAGLAGLALLGRRKR
jgi:hypothetical protein